MRPGKWAPSCQARGKPSSPSHQAFGIFLHSGKYTFCYSVGPVVCEKVGSRLLQRSQPTGQPSSQAASRAGPDGQMRKQLDGQAAGRSATSSSMDVWCKQKDEPKYGSNLVDWEWAGWGMGPARIFLYFPAHRKLVLFLVQSERGEFPPPVCIYIYIYIHKSALF